MAPQKLPDLLSLVCIDYGPSNMDILEASFFNPLLGLTFRLAGDAGDTLLIKHLHGRFPVTMSDDGEAFLVGHTAQHGPCVIAYNPRTRRGSFCKLNGSLRVIQLIGKSKLPFD